jgi:SAM-dependent methyltransferase
MPTTTVTTTTEPTTAAPSAFNQGIFFDPAGVFYGTDDGYQDGSFGEFAVFERFYRDVEPRRRENIHFVSAVGGLYGLNLMTCWQPTEITFFDINPHAVAYFNLVRRVWAGSSDKKNFLARLTHQDYDVENEAEVTIRENLALKQRGELRRERGSSYPRTLEVSWGYSLEHFDLTKRLLTEVPLECRVLGIESEEFAALLKERENLWIYASNIAEFTFSRFCIDHPRNAVLVSIIYPGQVDLLDLAPFGDRPVEARVEIPMTAYSVGESLIPEEEPTTVVGEEGRTLAVWCRDRLGLGPEGRILDVGCGWGRLAFGLLAEIGPGLEYQGFDPYHAHVRWAQKNLASALPRFVVHLAEIANEIYGPDAVLEPTRFRFPYSEGYFDAVVAHSLFRYLQPEAFEHYVAEIARVLKPGGRFLASFYLLNATSTKRLPAMKDPLCFVFPDGKVTTTRPHRQGLLAYREDYVLEVLARNRLQPEPIDYGSWEPWENGLAQDFVVAAKL